MRHSTCELCPQVRDSRECAGAQASDMADIQRRLESGHILSESELEMIRAQTRGSPEARRTPQHH